MKLIIDNVQSQAIIGGKDNLMPFNVYAKLKDYLSVKVDGAEYSDAYKRGHWNGMKAYITSDGRFGSGFVPLVLKYMVDLGVEVEIEDKRGDIPKMDLTNFDTAIADWTLRDYQEEAVKKIDNYLTYKDQQIYFPRGIIDAATNAGKNSIMAGIVKNFKGCKALMLIHNTDIKKQAFSYFSTVFNTGLIDGKNYEISQFTIGMQKTLLNRAIESMKVRHDLSKFEILFIDEAHFSGAEDYARLISMIPAPIRILVSGTPLDSGKKTNAFVTVGLSGRVLYKIKNSELIEKGVSLKPTIHLLRNKCRVEELNYDNQYSTNISSSKNRVNEFISFLETEGYKDKCILIAFEEIKHGEFMLNELKADPRLAGKRIDWVHGTDKDRDNKLSDFKSGKIDILLGSTIMQEGLNIPRIQLLWFALGGMSKIRVKQFIGRLLRTDGVSSSVIYVDHYDECRWLDKHSRTRIRIYKDEQFEIKYHYDASSYGAPKRTLIHLPSNGRFSVNKIQA